jgi:hypothetical protein
MTLRNTDSDYTDTEIKIMTRRSVLNWEDSAHSLFPPATGVMEIPG